MRRLQHRAAANERSALPPATNFSKGKSVIYREPYPKMLRLRDSPGYLSHTRLIYLNVVPPLSIEKVPALTWHTIWKRRAAGRSVPPTKLSFIRSDRALGYMKDFLLIEQPTLNSLLFSIAVFRTRP